VKIGKLSEVVRDFEKNGNKKAEGIQNMEEGERGGGRGEGEKDREGMGGKGGLDGLRGGMGGV